MKQTLLNKKGQSAISAGIGMVLTIVVIAVLAPMIFGTTGLGADFGSGAPTWLVPLLTIVAGIGLVRIILRSA